MFEQIRQTLPFVLRAYSGYYWYIRHIFKYRTLKNVLDKKIRGQKVLIVCSGPSAEALTELDIPKDVVVMSANLAPLLIPNVRELGVYITTDYAIEEGGGKIQEIVRTRNIGVLLVNSRKALSKVQGGAKSLVSFNPLDNHYFVALLGSAFNYKKRTEMACNNTDQHLFPSSGMQLLQYAIYFGASEIFVCGIDTQKTIIYGKNIQYGKNEGEAAKHNNHYQIDSLFIEYTAKKYKNIYICNTVSPLSKYFPVKFP